MSRLALALVALVLACREEPPPSTTSAAVPSPADDWIFVPQPIPDGNWLFANDGDGWVGVLGRMRYTLDAEGHTGEAHRPFQSRVAHFQRLGASWVFVTEAGEVFRADQPLDEPVAVGTFEGAGLAAVGWSPPRLALIDTHGELWVGDANEITHVACDVPTLDAAFVSATFGARVLLGGRAEITTDGGTSFTPIVGVTGMPSGAFDVDGTLVLELADGAMFAIDTAGHATSYEGPRPQLTIYAAPVEEMQQRFDRAVLPSVRPLLSSLDAEGRALRRRADGGVSLVTRDGTATRVELDIPAPTFDAPEGVATWGAFFVQRRDGAREWSDGTSPWVTLAGSQGVGVVFDDVGDVYVTNAPCEGATTGVCVRHRATADTRAIDAAAQPLAIDAQHMLAYHEGRLALFSLGMGAPPTDVITPGEVARATMTPDGVLFVETTDHRTWRGPPDALAPVGETGERIVVLTSSRLVAIDGTNVRLSHDGGRSWQPFRRSNLGRGDALPARGPCGAHSCSLGAWIWAEPSARSMSPPVAHIEGASDHEIAYEPPPSYANLAIECEASASFVDAPTTLAALDLGTERRAPRESYGAAIGDAVTLRPPPSSWAARRVEIAAHGNDATGPFEVHVGPVAIEAPPEIVPGPLDLPDGDPTEWLLHGIEDTPPEIRVTPLAATRGQIVVLRCSSASSREACELLAFRPNEPVVRTTAIPARHLDRYDVRGALTTGEGGVVVRIARDALSSPTGHGATSDVLVEIPPRGEPIRHLIPTGTARTSRALARDVRGVGLFVVEGDRGRFVALDGTVSAPIARPPWTIHDACDASDALGEGDIEIAIPTGSDGTLGIAHAGVVSTSSTLGAWARWQNDRWCVSTAAAWVDALDGALAMHADHGALIARVISPLDGHTRDAECTLRTGARGHVDPPRIGSIAALESGAIVVAHWRDGTMRVSTIEHDTWSSFPISEWTDETHLASLAPTATVEASRIAGGGYTTAEGRTAVDPDAIAVVGRGQLRDSAPLAEPYVGRTMPPAQSRLTWLESAHVIAAVGAPSGRYAQTASILALGDAFRALVVDCDLERGGGDEFLQLPVRCRVTAVSRAGSVLERHASIAAPIAVEGQPEPIVGAHGGDGFVVAFRDASGAIEVASLDGDAPRTLATLAAHHGVMQFPLAVLVSPLRVAYATADSDGGAPSWVRVVSLEAGVPTENVPPLAFARGGVAAVDVEGVLVVARSHGDGVRVTRLEDGAWRELPSP